MKNFIYNVIGSVLKSIVVFAILLLISLSIYSGKFPPSIKTIRDSITQLSEVKEKYTNLINRSESYLNEFEKAGGAHTNSPLGTNPYSQRPIEEANKAENKNVTEKPDGSTVPDDIKMQIYQIRSQLGRIEEQNRLILKSLKK